VGKTPWRTIIGVASEVRRLGEDDDSSEFELYFPHDRTAGVMTAVRPMSRIAEFRTIVIRAGAPAAIVRRLPSIVYAIDPGVVISRTDLVAHQFADAIARPRVVFLMLSVFAGFGLILAAAGLYGVLSCVVAQREREIGVRLALGAEPRCVGALILRNGLTLASAGLAIGLAAALVLTRSMRVLLYEVEPWDPAAVTLVSLVLAASALAACWRPAARAMRVDPVLLLRQE
jgi:predicted lysophospholipase L1 biosynthesis ABC-type transport system permease subunit